MYDAVPDPYCYSGTTVLKNLANIRDQESLEEFEAAMTTLRAEESLPRGRLSVSHYKSIHRHLFQDVYDWAGRHRTVRIAKDGSAFCYPENIEHEMQRLFTMLREDRYFHGRSTETFAADAAQFLSTLNAIHPFRDGNGRTQMVFLTLLAMRAGHPLNLDKLQPETFLAAMIASFKGDDTPLERQIRQLVSEKE